MTLDEIDRIRESFVHASEEMPAEVATLMTVLKFYGLEKQIDANLLTEWCGADEKGNINIGNISEAATRVGMQTEVCLLNVKRLMDLKLPLILFMWNDFNKPVYRVCYGIHEGRFILWDADWGGPWQFWPEDMEVTWIEGVSLRLFPSSELMRKAERHIKWWQLYGWTKWLKRCCDSTMEWIQLEVVPRFR